MYATQQGIDRARPFRMAATSGLITLVAANAPVFVWRNPALTVNQYVTKLTVKWRTVEGFAAAQELSFGLYLISAATLNYTGGTDLSNPSSTPAYINREVPYTAGLNYSAATYSSVLVAGNVRIALTGALTPAGSPVIQSPPFLYDEFSELSAAVFVQKGIMDMVFAPLDKIALPIGRDAGFVISPPITMGAGGAGRLSVEIDWIER